MGRTIKGKKSTAAVAPLDVIAPIVLVKQLWSDRWRYDTSIHFRRTRHSSGGEGIGSCELRRAYGGSVREPGLRPAASRDPIDRAGWWVKIVLILPGKFTTLWVGQISSSTKDSFADSEQAAGWQTWTAHDMLQLLTKTHIHQSWWAQRRRTSSDPNNSEVVEQLLGWSPSVNSRDARNLLVGNLSIAATSGRAFVFGGDHIWTHLNFLDYILERFVDNTDNNGPDWTVSGQTSILKELKTVIPIRADETVASLLRKLIPVDLALDFKISPYGRALNGDPLGERGFAVHVFSLNGEERGGGIVSPTGSTTVKPLPRNPNQFTVKPSESVTAPSIRVVETLDRQFDRIRVIGRRIVTCCTLEVSREGDPSFKSSLIPRWSHLMEDDYINPFVPPDNRTAQGFDAARRNEAFRLVYQAFGAPDDWDWQMGEVAPDLDTDGIVQGTGADRQSKVRATLPWIPLREGFNYVSRPPTSANVDNYEAPFLPPAAWILDETEESNRWLTVDQAGISIQTHPEDWGLSLSVSPNHLIAQGVAEFNDLTLEKTKILAKYDWHNLKYTVAFETDQRLELRYDRTSGWSDKGETLVINVPTAELWYLANDTVVGVDSAGQLLRTTGGQTLRNDSDRLGMVMAGAISRFNMQRVRATLRYNGYHPFGGSVGQILEIIESGQGAQYIGSPVTAVDWEAGGPGNPPTTTIHTGFAR